jgi:hypothetical protein
MFALVSSWLVKRVRTWAVWQAPFGEFCYLSLASGLHRSHRISGEKVPRFSSVSFQTWACDDLIAHPKVVRFLVAAPALTASDRKTVGAEALEAECLAAFGARPADLFTTLPAHPMRMAANPPISDCRRFPVRQSLPRACICGGCGYAVLQSVMGLPRRAA